MTPLVCWYAKGAWAWQRDKGLPGHTNTLPSCFQNSEEWFSEIHGFLPSKSHGYEERIRSLRIVRSALDGSEDDARVKVNSTEASLESCLGSRKKLPISVVSKSTAL